MYSRFRSCKIFEFLDLACLVLEVSIYQRARLSTQEINSTPHSSRNTVGKMCKEGEREKKKHTINKDKKTSSNE